MKKYIEQKKQNEFNFSLTLFCAKINKKNWACWVNVKNQNPKIISKVP